MYKNNLCLNVVVIACFLFGNAKLVPCIANKVKFDLPEWKCLYDRGYITSDIGPESPINIGQLQPGAKFPDLQGWTSENKAVNLLNEIAKKPTVISFYKSAYCGHCQWQFVQLMAAKEELNNLGFQLMAISHIKKDGIKRMEGRYNPPFPLYSDKDQTVGRALGFAFDKESPEVNMYPGRNDMGVYGSALYIVNTNGTIMYEWTYSDNKVRLSAENVIAAAKQVLTNKNVVFTNLKKAIKTPDKVVNLNLSYQDLKSIPVEIFKFPNLKVLHLTGNKISEIPAGIGKLTKLERLELSHNKINQLPPEIGLLKELKDLQLLDNNLITLPPEIGKLKKLVRLNLMYNPLEVLPPETGDLDSLFYLRLYGHHLNQLPPEIGDLKSLKNLKKGFYEESSSFFIKRNRRWA